jgi:phosphopantetheine adenylyltransferase
MVEENLAEFSNVTVELFDGLLVEHARKEGCNGAGSWVAGDF